MSATKQELLTLIDKGVRQARAFNAWQNLVPILQGILDIAEAGGNVQSDWNQNDSEKMDYIKNKPAVSIIIEADDIEALTGTQLDALKCGDIVAKKTGTAQHCYRVSYKDAENGGLCLTYTDASRVETVSYDHTESGWAYNSTDVTNLGE